MAALHVHEQASARIASAAEFFAISNPVRKERHTVYVLCMGVSDGAICLPNADARRRRTKGIGGAGERGGGGGGKASGRAAAGGGRAEHPPHAPPGQGPAALAAPLFGERAAYEAAY